MEQERKQRVYQKRTTSSSGSGSSFHRGETSHESSISHKRDRSAETKAIEDKINTFFEANKESGLRKLISAAKLMEVGAHIGLATKLWNPKMKNYIYPRKGNRLQVIDILKTMIFLDRAYNFLKDIAREGGKILFVGTRGQIIKEHIKNEAKRIKAYYVNQRWLGGTLTNFKTISKSVDKLNNLISLQMSDEIKKYSKKEQVMINKEVEKMNKFFGGIRIMRGLPQVIVVTDPVLEHNAVDEAKKLHIPVVALANTNANPDKVDFLIPANTNSIKTVYLLMSILCDAVAEANNEPLSVVGKQDDEIVLPEVVKRVSTQPMVSHKRFSRHSSSAE